MEKPIRSWIAAAALLASGAVVAPSASALPVLIDFTDKAWAGVQGQSTYSRTYGSVEVTLSTSGRMTFNDHEAPASGPSLALDGDGIGIGDDEISWGEQLDVRFSSAVTVLGYYFLDMFAGEGPGGMGELATVIFDTASFLDQGVATDSVGYYGREVSLETTSISFLAGDALTGGDANFAFSDYALAGILIDAGPVAVPEPGTLALFGFGIAGLMVARKRRAELAR